MLRGRPPHREAAATRARGHHALTKWPPKFATSALCPGGCGGREDHAIRLGPLWSQSCRGLREEPLDRLEWHVLLEEVHRALPCLFVLEHLGHLSTIVMIELHGHSITLAHIARDDQSISSDHEIGPRSPMHRSSPVPGRVRPAAPMVTHRGSIPSLRPSDAHRVGQCHHPFL